MSGSTPFIVRMQSLATIITARANYVLFIQRKTRLRYNGLIHHVIMFHSIYALLLTKNITSKMTGGIIPVVVATNNQDTAFIAPVVIGLCRQPVVVVPLWFIRPNEIRAGLPWSLASQPEPVVMRQLRYELILLLGVDWGQISLIRKY